MLISRADAEAIHSTRNRLRFLDRKIISDDEMISRLFMSFYGCETDDGIQQCVAVLPERLLPLVKEKVSTTLKNEHPGDLFVFFPMKPSPVELRKLDQRVRRIMTVVIEYLRNPTGIVDFEVDDPDGLRQAWGNFQQFETVTGELCRKPDCEQERVRLGIYCPKHHYEMIHGQLPPTD